MASVTSPNPGTDRTQATAPSSWTLTASGLALTFLSVGLIIYAASEEPFTSFQWVDAFCIIGLGPLLGFALIWWAKRCVGARCRSKRKVLAWVSAVSSIVWTLVLLLYLGLVMVGYAVDLIKLIRMQLPSTERTDTIETVPTAAPEVGVGLQMAGPRETLVMTGNGVSYSAVSLWQLDLDAV